MPAKGQNGNNLQGDDGSYYCDAKKLGGSFCPEFDIMEASKYSWRTTAHTCEQDEHGFYSSCDSKGLAHDADEWGNSDYGPSGGKINTPSFFHLKMDYCKSMLSGNFEGYDLHLSQSQFCTFTCKGSLKDTTTSYFKKLHKPLTDGMAFVFSNWGGESDDLTWLNHEKCN